MADEKQDTKSMGRMDLNSKFWKTFLVILSAFFTFGGPYLVYVLFHVLDINYYVSMISGTALFTVGLVLMLYLIKKRVIS
jgi:hypothetical protein